MSRWHYGDPLSGQPSNAKQRSSLSPLCHVAWLVERRYALSELRQGEEEIPVPRGRGPCRSITREDFFPVPATRGIGAAYGTDPEGTFVQETLLLA
ncbi:unnamed protein product [Lasius platythorax]|uniref:Uncharacterized protein n=1 Tax=Lasius platythorax TaxID=488582 RepID=A0AAV2NBE9_9HYME